ncbi:hypothetical protein PFISCL1PPCAC_27641 [Pristionchus fissidentatus]|uniref:Uncharacterized protein n=1 Tax=Pristionchus fissidentatus TaxID=1538716 RepID=A0AAV5X063_9BILA|nr:hypothetical protein PFISCL1PPCAC_27641 [Pristionchus fissidentatus]
MSSASTVQESEEERKVAVILTLMDVMEQVEKIEPDQKAEQSLREKKTFEAAQIESKITYIDDLDFSEEKALRRMLNKITLPARKVTFSEPIHERVLLPPHPPLSNVERTLEFIRKVGRFMCITEPDDDDFFDDEMEPFMEYQKYSFR